MKVNRKWAVASDGGLVERSVSACRRTVVHELGLGGPDGDGRGGARDGDGVRDRSPLAAVDPELAAEGRRDAGRVGAGLQVLVRDVAGGVDATLRRGRSERLPVAELPHEADQLDPDVDAVPVHPGRIDGVDLARLVPLGAPVHLVEGVQTDERDIAGRLRRDLRLRPRRSVEGIPNHRHRHRRTCSRHHVRVARHSNRDPFARRLTLLDSSPPDPRERTRSASGIRTRGERHGAHRVCCRPNRAATLCRRTSRHIRSADQSAAGTTPLPSSPGNRGCSANPSR